MEEVPIVAREEGQDAVKAFQAVYGGPAFLRRAREVEAKFEYLLESCRKQREEWLDMVRLRLGTLHALAGGWPALRSFLGVGDDPEYLEQLHVELAPRLRLPVEPTTSRRVLRQALADLRESMESFNRRWRKYLSDLDLSELNELREGYNRYYLLEKECALRSPRLARAGYVPLSPLRVDELIALFPPLRIPHVTRS